MLALPVSFVRRLRRHKQAYRPASDPARDGGEGDWRPLPGALLGDRQGGRTFLVSSSARRSIPLDAQTREALARRFLGDKAGRALPDEGGIRWR